MYNFADDNSLSAAAKTVTELKNTLHSESKVIINWFKNNKMLVNHENSGQSYWTSRPLTIQMRLLNLIIKAVEAVSSVRLLGIQLDD